MAAWMVARTRVSPSFKRMRPKESLKTLTTVPLRSRMTRGVMGAEGTRGEIGLEGSGSGFISASGLNRTTLQAGSISGKRWSPV